MRPPVRRFALTAHITASVGWLGVVVAFLALSISAMRTADEETLRGLSLAMETTGWYALLPLSMTSLLTGLLQSLGTTWGLFRHYWVIAKLVINVFATLILVLYLQTLGTLADIARQATLSSVDLEMLQSPSPTVHGVGALFLLLLATVFSVYKPRGMTRYGQRRLGAFANARVQEVHSP